MEHDQVSRLQGVLISEGYIKHTLGHVLCDLYTFIIDLTVVVSFNICLAFYRLHK